jgi:phosphoenolpyruvate-protein phosphotransferase
VRVFLGSPVSPGFGEGPAFLYRGLETLLLIAHEAPPGDPAVERARFTDAVAAARRELRALGRQIEKDYGRAEGRILHAQAFMLDDPLFQATVRSRLERGNGSAEAAVATAMTRLETRFRESADPYIRERALDVHDIGLRVLHHLADRAHHPLGRLPDGVVLLAEELLPSDTAFLDPARVRAIVTERGGDSSHVAILARALGIPAVTQVAGLLDAIETGDAVAVDGEAGRVIHQIEVAAHAEYARHALAYRSATDTVREQPYAEPVTRDGARVTLLANAAGPADVDAADRCGAAGIGLFRTEFFYLLRHEGVPEDEQAAAYRAMAARMGARPINIRTLDLAPDKLVPLAEDLPFARAPIRDRGVHHSLRHPELLRPQLRAILRAADPGRNLRILLPGVTGPRDVESVRALVEELRAELAAAGVIARTPPIGAMIETPPALLMAPEIARVADFLCIGTNDLLHYLFGHERQSGSADDTMYEPSLLRAIQSVVRAAAAAGKEVSLCGELAGAPAFTMLLLGLGLRILSMSPVRLGEIRYNLREITADDATTLADHALELGSAKEIRELLAAHASPWQRLVERRSAGS